MKCAVDCIISVISNNELILNNIADDIKISKAPEDNKKDNKNLPHKSVLLKNFLNFAKEKEVIFNLAKNSNILLE